MELIKRAIAIIVAVMRAIFSGKQLVLPDDLNEAPVAPPLPPSPEEPEPSSQVVSSESPPPVEVVEGPAIKLSPLFFDTYQGDYPVLNLSKVVENQLYYGVILKATEGDYYFPSWFLENWKKAKEVAKDRYGDTWFRGCYHYLKANISGTIQAESYLNHVRKAGGWDYGDLWPIVDVERGADGSANYKATRQQWIDVTTAWATKVKEETGRQVMLYGNQVMYEFGIKNKMNCDWLWPASYLEQLHPEIYLRAGWSKDRVVFWQYAGDSKSKLKGYPAVSPLGPNGDISVLVMEGGIERLRSELQSKP